MLARYEGAYAATTLIVMGDRSGFAWKDVPSIQLHRHAGLREAASRSRCCPATLCTDAEFIRRVYLDLTGLPPTARARSAPSSPTPGRSQRQARRADRQADRQPRLHRALDEQVGRPAAGQSQVPGRAGRAGVPRLDPQGRRRQHALRQVRLRHPDGVAARTWTTRRPAITRCCATPDAVMENTTQLFLAVRFNCNKCHDHPVRALDAGPVLPPGRVLRPGRPQPRTRSSRARRSAAPPSRAPSRWSRSSTTARAARSSTRAPAPIAHADVPVSRTTTWPRPRPAAARAAGPLDHVEGEPVFRQELRQPPVELPARRRHHRADRRHPRRQPADQPAAARPADQEFVDERLQRRSTCCSTICKSRTYQHSITTNQWNQDDDINYSHAIARRLPAEVLYDAIHRATGSVSRLPGLPPGRGRPSCSTRTSTMPGGFLDLFGKPPRESACECERSGSMMLGPVLNLVNGPVVGEAHQGPEQPHRQAAGHREGRRQGGRGAVPGRPVPAADARPSWQQGLQGPQGAARPTTPRLVAEHDQAGRRVDGLRKGSWTPNRPQWEKRPQDGAGLDGAGRGRARSRPAARR